MTWRRIVAGVLSVALLVSSMMGVSILSVSAEDYTAWVNTHNQERYRGTSLTATERVIYTATDGGSNAVKSQATAITAGKTSDADRLLAIHDWVADNIAYDYDFYEEKTTQTGKTADEVLQLRRAVCRGIAELTMQLCRAVNIPCKTVDGYTLGKGESWGAAHQALRKDELNHVWNEAYVNGRWQIVDVTWDCAGAYRAGTVTKGEVGHEWFDIPPASLSDSRLNLEDIVDGTFVYTQATDGTLTLTAPLDSALTAANIPAEVVGRAVVAVGDQAFSGCKTLATVTLPDTVKTLGHSAFSGTGLSALPDLRHIIKGSDNLFAGCAALTTATLPAHWATLPAGMFQGCTQLSEITLPTALKEIGNRALANCQKLTTITLPDGLERVGHEAFAASGLTTITLPDSVTTLGTNVFQGCVALAAATLSDGMTTIGSATFSECTTLATLVLPQNTTRIGEQAFFGCASLQNVVLPNTVERLDDRAFADCENLAAITLSERLRYIGKSAFAGCKALTAIILPSTVETIEESAFQGCARLETVHLPAAVTAVGEQAFADCTSLESITVAEENTALQVHDGALYAVGEPYTLLAYPPCRPNTTFTVPSEVKRVGTRAFVGATFLEEVRIDAAITDWFAWGEQTFMDCTSLREVHMADGSTHLGVAMFENCTALTTITLPNTLLQLGDFENCTQLKELNIPASVRNMGPMSTTGLEQIHVHEDNETLYDIDGVVFFRSNNGLLCYPPEKRDATYTAPVGTACVYDMAFAGNKHLTAVTFGEGLRKIARKAFSGCEALCSVTLAEGVTDIFYGAFEYTALREISLPSSVVSLDEALHNTPWWDAQPDGVVYCGDILYDFKGDTWPSEELVVCEGTRLIASPALPSAWNIKRLVIPPCVEIVMWSELPSDIVIVGERGSAAERYANENGYAFVDPNALTWGDVNSDGKVNTTDARVVLQYAAEVIGEYDLSLAAADVNGDDKVNTTDARTILQHAANLIDKFPVEE